jgi:hypothetical protein
MIAQLGASGQGSFASGTALGTLVPSFVFNTFFSGFGVFFALVIVLMIVGMRRERARRERLRAYAVQHGWRRLTPDAPVPGPVAKAAASRRTQLAFATNLRGFDLWLVWHRWTESSGSGENSTHHTRHLTRYFLWPGRPCPQVRLMRRTRIGASFMPVRGLGTGDPEFDRRFLMRGDERFAISSALRQAMIVDELPAWDISDGILTTEYRDAPTADNLQWRADAIARIAQLLG